MNYYNLINKEYCNYILKTVKNLKSSIVYITKDYIIGVNDDYTILSVMQNIITKDGFKMIELNKDICFRVNDLANLLKYADTNGFDIYENGYYMICNDLKLDIIMSFHREAIRDLYSKMSFSEIHNNCILNIQDLRNYFIINDIDYFSLKSGSKMNIKLNRHLITILHGNLLPVNKSDKIDLSIYEYNQESSIYVYSIYKSKIKNTINVYMCCLSLD